MTRRTPILYVAVVVNIMGDMGVYVSLAYYLRLYAPLLAGLVVAVTALVSLLIGLHLGRRIHRLEGYSAGLRDAHIPPPGGWHP